MKIRVLLNRIQEDISGDFAKAKDYFARHGLAIEWAFESSNIKGYKAVIENFGASQRLQITGHQKQIQLSKDCITVFVFSGNEFTIPNIPTSKCELYPTGVLVTLMTYTQGSASENALTLFHELMHAINKQLSLKGVSLVDPMDILWRNGQPLYYWHNDQPEASDSNFGEAWKTLTPYLNVLNPITAKVTIVRTKGTAKETTGTLTAQNRGASFACKTLELAWKNNQPNISSIPKGVYNVKWTFSPRFLKFTYEVQSVLGRSGIRIHAANFFSDLNGCIALGENLTDINSDGELDTTNSRATIASFEGFMQKQPFILEIK